MGLQATLFRGGQFGPNKQGQQRAQTRLVLLPLRQRERKRRFRLVVQHCEKQVGDPSDSNLVSHGRLTSYIV